MATCPHADRLIPLLHDNELQSPLRREMVTHMATCVTCARTFSLLEREQELFTQTVEECVESIDFSGFWQAVEIRLSEPSLSWAAWVRLWYESWRPTWAFPVPVWAVATLLLSFVFTHLYLNNNFSLFSARPEKRAETPSLHTPSEALKGATQSPPEELHPTPTLTSHSDTPNNLGDDQAQIEFIESHGDGAIVIQIRRDYESKSTFISFGDGTSEYPQ